MSFIGGLVSGLGSIVGASSTASAAKQAAAAQVKSAQIAADTQQNMFGQAKNALQPFMGLGYGATNALTSRFDDLTQSPAVPGPMDEATLQATPGYQFTLDQGLKATQNGAAARGLGVSGAAMKGAASYATGLSDQTYNTRFNQAQTLYQDQTQNKTNDFNKLFTTAGLGTQAAGALAGQAIQTGQGVAQSQMASGNAQAAGINAAGQAGAAGITGATGAFNNALSQYMNANTAPGLYSSSGNGGMANMLGRNFLNGGL